MVEEGLVVVVVGGRARAGGEGEGEGCEGESWGGSESCVEVTAGDVGEGEVEVGFGAAM